MRTNLTADIYRRLFTENGIFFGGGEGGGGNCGFLDLFLGTKVTTLIKITFKTNQIDIGVCLFQK